MEGKRILYRMILLIGLMGLMQEREAAAQADPDEAFDAYLATIEDEFYSFEDSINRDYARYLEQSWQEFTVYDGIEPPVYVSGRGGDEAYSAVALSPEVPAVAFFGRSLNFPSPALRTLSLADVSEKQVANGWRELSSANFNPFLNTCRQFANEMNLNDWGSYLLYQYIARQEYALFSEREQTLLLFYLFSNSGYRVKIGRTEAASLVLLMPFQEEVYKCPFVRMGTEKYYIHSKGKERPDKLYSFDADFPKAVKKTSLAIQKELRFPLLADTRSYRGKYPTTRTFNKHATDYYATWPLCDLSVYFRSVPSAGFGPEIDQWIRPHLENKSPFDRVRWLLDFVQHQFIHKPDKEVHGSEKYYFPEELFVYPYADCEDLSVLLTWLIRRYCSLEVLTLYYQEHVAVAVEQIAGYNGELFVYQDKKYFICDPSYKGAAPGSVIPACASREPVVISYFK